MRVIKLAIRSQFIASPGNVLIAFDFSQAESWIVAFSANEQSMKHALQFEDIHTNTAANALFNIDVASVTKEQRYVGKRCNHALAYGMSAERMAQVINKDARDSGVNITLAQARTYHRKWHNFYHIQGWWLDIQRELSLTRTLITAYGRKRVFYGQWGNELFKEGYAFIPQGSVADHCLGCVCPELGIHGGVLSVHKLYKNRTDVLLVNTSHDSLVLDVHKSIADDVIGEVYPLMHRPLIVNGEMFTIPVDCEVGEVYGELEKRKMAA